jgi:hypothetical protein
MSSKSPTTRRSFEYDEREVNHGKFGQRGSLLNEPSATTEDSVTTTIQVDNLKSLSNPYKLRPNDPEKVFIVDSVYRVPPSSNQQDTIRNFPIPTIPHAYDTAALQPPGFSLDREDENLIDQELLPSETSILKRNTVLQYDHPQQRHLTARDKEAILIDKSTGTRIQEQREQEFDNLDNHTQGYQYQENRRKSSKPASISSSSSYCFRETPTVPVVGYFEHDFMFRDAKDPKNCYWASGTMRIDTGSAYSFVSSEFLQSYQLEALPLRPGDIKEFNSPIDRIPCRPRYYVHWVMHSPRIGLNFLEISLRVMEARGFDVILGSADILAQNILPHLNRRRQLIATLFGSKPNKSTLKFAGLPERLKLTLIS